MRSPRPLLFIAVAGSALALSACTGPTASAPASSEPAIAVSASPTPAATASASPDAGPVQAFESWWAAVRAADTVAACGALTEPLQQRMIAEYTDTTGIEVSDCATLIQQSSALYAATGASAEVEVAVVSQSDAEAVLDVTYASGDCGTVHLDHSGATWMLTELSQECTAG